MHLFPNNTINIFTIFFLGSVQAQLYFFLCAFGTYIGFWSPGLPSYAAIWNRLDTLAYFPSLPLHSSSKLSISYIIFDSLCYYNCIYYVIMLGDLNNMNKCTGGWFFFYKIPFHYQYFFRQFYQHFLYKHHVIEIMLM